MGVRENKVERYLRDRFRKAGGGTRKWVSPGRDGVPDQIAVLHGTVIMVEVKTVDGKLSSVQTREQRRLRDLGLIVTTVYGERGVDALMDDINSLNNIREAYDY